METGVLQQNDVAVVHGSHSSLCVVAHDGVVVRKHNGLAQLCAQRHSNGCQAELCLGAVLGLAQVAAQDDLNLPEEPALTLTFLKSPFEESKVPNAVL